METLIDLHTHTIVSGHAYSTVLENVAQASKIGLKYIGLSEHAPQMPGGPNEFYFHNSRCIPDMIDGVRVLKGIEANILDYDGNTDVDEGITNSVDYIIASLHPPCIKPGTKQENTNTIIEVMKKDKVKIIGHLDDSRYPVDYEEVAKAAKEHGVLLEINNSSLKKTSFRVGARENVAKLLEACKKYGVYVIYGSDAHISFDVGNFVNSKEVVELNNFPKELVINYHEDKIIEVFEI